MTEPARAQQRERPPPEPSNKGEEPMDHVASRIADTMEYPAIRKLQGKLVSHTALSGLTDTAQSSRQPQSRDTFMGPVGYLPANRPESGVNLHPNSAFAPVQVTRPHQHMPRPKPPDTFWDLPGAHVTKGVMLVLPQDPNMNHDVISRWESITLNLVNGRQFDTNQDKVNFMENLLGTDEKAAWMTWRMAYDADYQGLVNVAGDAQNVISAFRKMFTGEDPYEGVTEIQNRAYQDLEKLSCPDMKNILPFLNQYRSLAARSGRMWAGPELSEKLFRKLPSILSNEIEAAFYQKHPGVNTNVILRINFIWACLTEMCKRAAIQRSLKDLSFCRDVSIPGYYSPYGNNGSRGPKKYGLRKAQHYKGKPHDTHVRLIRNKDKARNLKDRNCKCYICGDPNHFAKECPRGRGNINRAHYLDNMDLPDDWDVVSVKQGESDSSEICSLSEHEGPAADLSLVQKNLPYEPEPTGLQEQIEKSMFHIQIIFMKDKIENYKNFDRKTKKNNKKSRVEEPN